MTRTLPALLLQGQLQLQGSHHNHSVPFLQPAIHGQDRLAGIHRFHVHEDTVKRFTLLEEESRAACLPDQGAAGDYESGL